MIEESGREKHYYARVVPVTILKLKMLGAIVAHIKGKV